MRQVFETAGDIRSVDLLASFVSLWRDNASGEIRFSRSGASAGFEFREGEIVASHSSQSQFDVGAILERGGKLDPAAVSRLERPPGSDPAIAALQANLITVREWKWGQKIRAIEVLSDLLGWLEGEYTHDPAALPEAGDWTLPIPRLVLELFLRSRDRTLVEHYLGPSDLPLVRSERFEEEFGTFALTSDAASVIDLIDGKASAEEIAAKAPADEFAVLKLLAALTTLGLIHPLEAAPPKPSPPPAKKRKKEPAKEPEPPVTPVAAPLPESEPERPIEEELVPPPEVEPPEPLPEEPPEASPPVLELSERLPEEAEEPPSPEIPEAEAAPVPQPELEALSPSEERLPVLPFDPVSTPADLMSEPYEPPPRELEGPIVEQEERELGGFEPPPPSPPPPPAFLPPDSGGRRGSGGLLAALIAILVIAIAAVVVVRVRSRSAAAGEQATAAPTPQEAPAFPPAETAVPLPRRGRVVVTTPTATSVPRTATASPTTIPSPTVRPVEAAPTKPPTATRTSPPPTRTPTATATHRPPTMTRTPTATRTQTPTRAAPTKTFTPLPTRPVPTKTATPLPTATRTKRPPTTARPATAPPTKAPTKPAPTKLPTPAPAQPPSTTTTVTGETGRDRWIRRAERDRQALAKRANARYAVQLELACEVETLEKAWAWDNPAGTMWLLTTSYRGRTCFRVLWGHYATLAQAQAARPNVPSFFVVPGNRPVPVPVR